MLLGCSLWLLHALALTSVRAQGRVVSLGVLKTHREWVNSLAIIAVSALLFGVNQLIRSVNTSRGDRVRAKAQAALGAN